jgi:[ribosomal protein S5]-alanine N-acetyltransferase
MAGCLEKPPERKALFTIGAKVAAGKIQFRDSAARTRGKKCSHRADWGGSSDLTPSLETPRLLLRPLELADADRVQILFPQWEIVRYLSKQVPWPYPPDGAYRFYKDVALPALERGDAWHWTLRLKGAPTRLVGSISLMREDDSNQGFWIGLPWQKQGLMTEACEVVTDYWFDVLKFPFLRVPKAIANTASRRLSGKQGMRVVATAEREYVCGRLPTELWEITADEWHARRNPE